MLIDSLLQILERDLEKLKTEILLFDNESDIWLIAGDVKNSPGNLCLHICGNLKHFVGHVLGGTEYIRDRQKEFTLKNVTKEHLINNINETLISITDTFKNLSLVSINETYPIKVFEKEMSTEYFLIHLTTHLNYHLGQINYIRRLLAN